MDRLLIKPKRMLQTSIPNRCSPFCECHASLKPKYAFLTFLYAQTHLEMMQGWIRSPRRCSDMVFVLMTSTTPQLCCFCLSPLSVSKA
ncbi:uncharacterized protein K489DRAFT_51856 [Dissoconium aciculare CBS 342.82]|uniref:Uncharacterized protein n=1 Tax=Dissoconium aciculare CBS 342.82 TaxID=1314786 RepID=A0A6J3M057_9PEZI|nr:uncharacterized protein K489DRAFT_51856 [Dissoconium aciculare CBS 342.82]KAF1820272.1 hypothetical protein K489DRAFT_51856 [Dissoconium aciculare CBS 342.82]